MTFTQAHPSVLRTVAKCVHNTKPVLLNYK